MAKKYLDQLTALMEEVTSNSSRAVEVEYKHFFSGAAVYADGRICITLTPVGFAIKLPEAARDVLLREHRAQKLRYFPKGPIKKDYVVLPNSMLGNLEELAYWVGISIDYVHTLPKPVKGRGK